MSDKLEGILKLMVELDDTRNKQILQLDIEQKRLHLALLNKDDKAAEEARQNCVDIFTASLDSMIAIHKRASSLKV